VNLDTRPPIPGVPCAGSARFFDLAYAVEDPERQASKREVLAMARPALELCATCPLANQEWCYEQTSPEESGLTGVAAGSAWYNGMEIDAQHRLRRLVPLDWRIRRHGIAA
jgi:hypothetical protein